MIQTPAFVAMHAAGLEKYISKRAGEVKLGQNLRTPGGLPLAQFLAGDFRFCVLGVPEDIGVMANHGRPGARGAWDAFLTSFLNIQANDFLNGTDVCVLGHFDFDSAYALLQQTPAEMKIIVARQLCAATDLALSKLIELIVRAGKIPIIIGGGHNNSYGNLRGLSAAKETQVNCINMDPHADLRELEGRHSGNGFRYALEEGFLKHYFVFGLHESYNSQTLVALFKTRNNLSYIGFEDLMVRSTFDIQTCLLNALEHIKWVPFGVEVDLDSLALFPASAFSPSGFQPEVARQFVHQLAQHPNCAYLHLCEAAPDLDPLNGKTIVGKMLSYLATDFIKAMQKIAH